MTVWSMFVYTINIHFQCLPS